MFKKTLIKLVSVAVLLAICATTLFALALPSSAETKYFTYRTGGNGPSSSYKSSKYYTQLTNTPITGDDRTDVLAIALSQIGYIEGASSSELAGTYSSGNADFCEMNYNSGSQYGYGYYWCASFVSFCLFQSLASDHGTYDTMCRNHVGDTDYIWKEISCTSWINNLKSAGAYKYSKAHGGSYTPQTGDAIFFSWTSSPSDPWHIGLVAYVDEAAGLVYTVEGNTSAQNGLDDNGDGCYFKSYTLDDSYIIGYGAFPFRYEDLDTRIDFSGKNPTTGRYLNSVGYGCYIYSDKECTVDSGATLYAYEQFDVIEVVEKYTSGDELSLLKIDYNGTVGYIKDKKSRRLIQIAKDEEKFIPEKPEIKTFSNNSITLESGGTGYEYKMDNGSWQKSNFFKGLSDSKSYKFYQRFEGGEASPALSVNLGTLLKGKELKSITVDGYDITPKFSANTKTYTVRVPDSLTTVPEVTATAAVNSTAVKIDVGNIINKTAVVYINLTPEVGPKATYTISFLYVPEDELNAPAETMPEETTPSETAPGETAPGETDELGNEIPPVETDEFGNEIPPVETDEFGNEIPPAETNDTLEGETGSETDAKADAGSIISKLGCKASSATLAVSGVVGLISLFTIVGVKKKKED